LTNIEFMTVDVFTRSHFAGNPLAVIPDARELAPALMQRVAREFNYSETTFVLPPDDPAHTARVRIFTPLEEIPFAGHPNVGTAYMLGRIGTAFGRRVGPRIVFEEVAGLVEVVLIYEGATLTGAQFDAPHRLHLGDEIVADLICECASLARGDVRLGVHRPIMASVGLTFAIAELTSVEALGRAQPNAAAFAAADARHPSPDTRFSLFLYAHVADDPLRLRARLLAPLTDLHEDPATGSAAAALGALLSGLPGSADGTRRIAVEQGIGIGRPSTMEVTTVTRHGTVERVSISGMCAPVMRGTIEL
jgi:trans-2,3-dihydro-3-hydroxyanthranilate isomerase